LNMSSELNAVLDRIKEAQRVVAYDNMTPLEFLKAVYCNPNIPLPVRMRAAIEAAPYVHATYKATALVVGGEDFATRLERAIARSRGEPKVIDHKLAGA
jgi:hypothetical protein